MDLLTGLCRPLDLVDPWRLSSQSRRLGQLHQPGRWDRRPLFVLERHWDLEGQLHLSGQERQPDLCVLLVSGFSAELIDADSVAPPDWALLPKPYSRADLARGIGQALRRNDDT